MLCGGLAAISRALCRCREGNGRSETKRKIGRSVEKTHGSRPPFHKVIPVGKDEVSLAGCTVDGDEEHFNRRMEPCFFRGECIHTTSLYNIGNLFITRNFRLCLAL
jgi:hypothetical protein